MTALERFANMNAPCPCKVKSGSVPTKEEWMAAMRGAILEVIEEFAMEPSWTSYGSPTQETLDRMRRDLRGEDSA